MRRVYLVDFENVHDLGLDGICELHRRDLVVIFYSNNANKIVLDAFTNTKATIKFIKVECGTSNALDFQLVGYLCRKAKKWNKYYIVSKDKGYTPVIRLLANEGIKVFEANTIKAFLEKSETSVASDSEKIISMDAHQNTKYIEKDNSYYEEKIAENDPITEIAVIIMEKIGVYPADDMMQLIIEGLQTTVTKSDFYIFCTKNMGQAAGQTFYSKVRKVYGDMKALAELVS